MHAKDSPTYADPNDGGRFRIGLNRNGSGFVLDARLFDGGPRNDSDAGAVRGGTFDESGAEIGYWDTRAGRDSLEHAVLVKSA